MSVAVPPVAGLANWLVFWLKAYICVIAISMLADVGTHFIPTDFADSLSPHGVAPLLVAHASAAQEEGLDIEEEDAFAAEAMDDLADEDPAFGLGLTLWDTMDLAVSLAVGFAFIGLYLLTGVLFLRWVYRMAANLRVARREEFPYTPLWSVCCFFIPFVNIVAPPRIMQRIWSTVSGSTEKSLVSVWWALVVVQTVLDQAESRMLTTAWRRGQEMQLAFSNAEFFLGLGANLVNAIVAVFTLLLVQQITREYVRHVAGGPAEVTG
jgi:hypothetical protein